MRNHIKILTICSFVFLSSCIKDPCRNTICENGGYCANGDCVCPEGYTGSDCSQQMTPTKILISKIEVTNFPQTDNGNGWDVFDGPDIFVKVFKGNTLLWDAPIKYDNAINSSIYQFNPAPYIEFSDVTSQYTIELWDYDATSANDWMGGIFFTPYNSTNNFPTSLDVDAGTGLSFTIYMEYRF